MMVTSMIIYLTIPAVFHGGIIPALPLRIDPTIVDIIHLCDELCITALKTKSHLFSRPWRMRIKMKTEKERKSKRG